MDKENTKVIFLDIDGVLTNVELDNTSFCHLDPSRYMLSPVNLAFLDNLLKISNAKIVIASNWRKFKPPHTQWLHGGKLYNSTLEPFKEMYKDCIIGMLPPERHATKSDCLEFWFEDNPWLSKNAGKYVILDDDLNEMYQNNVMFRKHFVLTDYRVGLTRDDVQKAIEMLK